MRPRCMRGLLLGVGALIGAAQAVSAQQPVTLAGETEPVPLGLHLETLRDEHGQWTLDDVRASPLADRFVAGKKETFNFGLSRVAYWYRASLRNPAEGEASPSLWVLEMQLATLDFIDVYLTRSDGSTESVLTGDMRPAPPEQLAHGNFAIPFWLIPGESVLLHLRVQMDGAHIVRPTLWSARAFQVKTTRENLLYGVFYGIMLVMALYNLIIGVWIRDRTYLFYVLYILAGTYGALIFHGHAREYASVLFAGAPTWISTNQPLAINAANFFAVLFSREFMSTRLHVPRVDRLYRMLAVLAVLCALISPLLPNAVNIRLALALLSYGAVMGLVVSGYLSLQGVRAARFYLLAWSVLLVGVLLRVLDSFGVIPTSTLTLRAMVVGMCFDVTLLSLALADRINQERKEKFVAHTEAQAASARASRLKSFLPERVAEMVVGGDRGLLEPKRRQITVCVIDLRGFTPFSETSAPEDVMAVLREFYETMGAIVEKHGGTVEHFAGDSMLIFFNAPLEVAGHEEHAVRAALEMREAFEALRARWLKLGHELGLGIGIADGYATIGAIGFSGRSQYAAIGAVTNLATRLCANAGHAEILTTPRVLAAVEHIVESESAGEQTIKGFHRPVAVMRVRRLNRKTDPTELVSGGAF